jgi:hypothetical protein
VGLVGQAIARIDGLGRWLPVPELRKLDEVKAILDAPDEVRLACVHDLAGLSLAENSSAARQLLPVAARKRLPLTVDDAAQLFELAAEADTAYSAKQLLQAVVGQLEAAAESWSAADRERLAPLIAKADKRAGDAKLRPRLRGLTTEPGALPLHLIGQGDDVAARFAAIFEDAGPLLELLTAYPESGRATAKWTAQAEAVEPDAGRVVALLDALLEAGDARENVFIAVPNERIACGVAALAGRLGDPGLLDRLRRLAIKSATTIGGQYGNPRSLRLANHCAQAIADVGAPASITELLALERAVRHGTLLNQIRKAIDSLAAAQGMTRDELLERAVEDHGLEPDGTRTVPLARGHALVEVDATSVTLSYVDEAGKAKKSFPADLKEAVAEVRAQIKAIRKTLSGERHRLDGLMAADPRWPFEDWRAYYLDHPVTGRLARSLIWGFGDVVGIPVSRETALTSAGEEVAIPADAEVRLWHPIDAEADEVQAWRHLLLERLIVQPFKQAWREIYVLTPAERQTRVYSNRFASHVFRQVQARALMKGRGWKPVALAWWDDGIDHGVARRAYGKFRAEFFFDPIYDMAPETGDLYPYCTSDQLRFFRDGGDEPVDLADVSRLVLSEAMRDVDLFVGVTSIGTDPEWLDRGEGRRFENYWTSFAFGELAEAGKVRREVLERLLPKLAIADRCSLDERHLVVRGDLRTYKIHLGSANIQMEPNDEYLCIVGARDRRADKLWLPFDDDAVLSLVLSKAFLLADDTSISDETITAQISRS